MKMSINKSAKRALSLVLAFAMLIGTLFVANVGININASALDVSSLTISYWNKDFEVQLNGFDVTSTSYINDTGAKGTTADDPIIIDDAKELATLVRYGNYQSTAGYFFKLSDKLDVIILQPENVVDAAELMSLSSGTATKEFFDNHANKAQFADWGALCDNGSFAGNFDGNGVEIYGLWMDPTANNGYGRQHGGLFGGTDAGVWGAYQTGADGDKTYNDTGVTYQNIIIKNSYYFGYRRMGAIIPSTNGPNYGCSSNGKYNIKNCVVANCFMECTGYNGTNEYGVSSNGILIGSTDNNDVPIVTNCLVYGNVAENKVTTYKEGTTLTAGPFSLVGQCSTYTNKSGVTTKPSISNTVAIGTPACVYNYRTTADICTNVYSTANDYSTPGVTSLFDAETLCGASAMAWMPEFNWGTDWFAVEGELPTPIEPATYIPVSEKPDSLYESGDGTKESPYIIRTVDQLYQMVNEESYSGTYTDTVYDYATSADKSITSYYSKYYKVADGVTDIYINDVDTQAEVKALAESGSCNKWAPTASFFAGNFDGNGVTIYGMVSTTGKGFVNKIDGTHAAIKNVHFKAAYVKGSSRAAVVTTDFGGYGIGYKATEDATATTYFNREFDPNGEEVNDWFIANIAVTESYIETTLSGSDNVATAGGIITLTGTPQWLTVKNCLFDGASSTLIDASATTAGASTASMKAGIASITAATTTNRWEFANCVSINEYPVSMKSGGSYGRFTKNSSGGSCEIATMYGLVNSDIDTTTYSKFSEIIALNINDIYATTDAPLLDWATTWKLVDVEFDADGNATRTIPMPVGLATTNAINYTDLVPSKATQVKANTYTGSGTESDPFLITNATELAKAIATGGVHLEQPLYFKLANDIDLSGNTWFGVAGLTAAEKPYTEFGGVLDGDGHTIVGLSAIDEQSAGLIPVLSGGTVKNVHIRDSYAGSATASSAGLIAGVVNEGSSIENCSVESSTAVNSEAVIIGNWTAASGRVTNSYIVSNGEQIFSSDVDKDSLTIYPAENAEWYKGPDGVARHISFAKAHTVTDVDGDGIINENYTPNDLAALRNYLLGVSNFSNIYGDVNASGATNISDLAVLRRAMVGSYNSLADGFWRNLELGKIKIYYGENDNYDAARKLELYLENVVPGVDIDKVVVSDSVAWGANSSSTGTYVHNGNIAVLSSGTFRADNTNEKGYVQLEDEDQIAKYALDGNLQIVVGDIGTEYVYESTVDYDKYEVTFDATNMALWVKGGSFTAVEQAVLDLIATDAFKNKGDFTDGTIISDSVLNSERFSATGYVQTVAASSVTKTAPDLYKSRRVVIDENGTSKYYYYAWGDEFESDAKTTYSSSNWNLTEYRTEDETVTKNDDGTYDVTSTETGAYLNLESPNFASLPDLWVVENGRLTIKRGYRGTLDGYTDPDGDYADVSKTIESGTLNDFGSHIGEEDVYIDPGDISTLSTMLFKYGYAEMRASLPSDGHAFPAWWFLTGPGRNTNSGINSTLYGKVYTLNNGGNAWDYDGTTDKMNGSNLNSYKYQIPAAHLEFDIVELMQSQSGTTTSWGIKTDVTTGNFIDYFQPTVHKIYTENVYNNETTSKTDDILYIPDWVNGKYSAWCTYDANGKLATDDSNLMYDDAYLFTSLNEKPYLNNYNHDNYNATYPYYYFSSGDKNKAGTFSMSNVIGGINSAADTSYTADNQSNDYWTRLQGTYTYGFTWDADPSANTYTLAIYCDLNADGTMSATDGEQIFRITEKTGYASSFGTDPTISNNTDADMWNQYAYAILDNAFYTSNANKDTTTVSQFTDLAIASGEKSTFDIEYVRVYQENGKRDIVTPETEDFNNSNHFGY